MSAAFLDALLSVPFVVPGTVVLFVGPRERSLCTDCDGVESVCDVPTGGTIGLATVLSVAGVVVYLVIHVRMLGRGATWGRGAVGCRVVDAGTLEPIGTGRAVARYVASILSALPCSLGFFWRLWDGEHRTFHDLVVGTRAIRHGSGPEGYFNPHHNSCNHK